MSGATAPLWVTVMLGVLTVVGTIAGMWGGQVIAARRDDRRWDRETAREDLRWERERARLADERTHAELLHWRDERLRLYAKFVGDLSEWQLSLVSASETTLAQEHVSVPQKRRAFAAKKAAVESCAAASLFASTLARAEFNNAMIQMHKLHVSCVDDEVGGDAWAVAPALVRVENGVRFELGLDGDAALPLPFSQAPPSGPTS